MDDQTQNGRRGALTAEQPTQQAMRQMTPDEIRRDELVNLIERIGMEPRGRSIRVALRIIEGRIAALDPRERHIREMEAAGVISRADEEVDAVLRAFGHNPVREVREQTEDEIRAAELAMLLDFVQGDPIDGAPTLDEVISGIKHRIGDLTPRDVEPVQAEQPSDPLARIAGAIASEAREMDFGPRMEFLTGIVHQISHLVSEATGQEVVGWTNQQIPEVPEAPQVDLDLGEALQSIVLPTAISFLDDYGEQLDTDIRRDLVTVVAARLTEKLSR